MIRVMIADDELLVRVGLRSVLDWEKHGFTIVAEASTGVEAYRRLHTQPVDILLLDIQMPEMDGLELMEKMRAEGIGTKVIILSCHNDFDMVRKALRLGACDYVPKLSLSMQTLLNILTAISGTLETAGPGAADDGREGWLALCERYDGEIWERLRPRSPLAPEDIRAIYIQVDHLERLVRDGELPDADRFLESCRALLLEIAQPFGPCVAIADRKRRLILLISGVEGEEALQALGAAIDGGFRSYFDRTVSIGVGVKAVEITRLPEGAHAALQALRRSFFTGPGSLNLGAGDDFPPPDSAAADPERIVRALKGRDYEQASSLFRQWLEDSAGWRRRTELLMGLEEIILCLHKLLTASGADTAGLAAVPAEEPVTSMLHRFPFFSELREWAVSFFEHGLTRLSAVPGQAVRSEIKAVIRLLEERYTEKLELAEIARQVSMNPSYLSNLFKRETGKGVVEYLTEYRMKRAGDLLRRTDLPVGEVARRVGYDNIFYFSRVFKRFHELSPSEYKHGQVK